MTAAAQLVILGHDRPDVGSELRALLARHAVGGVFLHGDALGEPAQVRQLTAELQSLTRELPLLIAVAQEGGSAQAWGPPHQEALPSAAEVGWEHEASGELLEVTLLGLRTGRQLAAAGVNLALAPVLDVRSRDDDPVLDGRCFGNRPELVAEVGGAFIEGLHAAGVLACAKHFPGRGHAEVDPRSAFPVVRRDRAQLEAVELLPFAAAFGRGLEVLTAAPVLFPAWDAARPAVLSPAILDDLLRRDLGFGGLVLAGDLDEAAVDGAGDPVELAVQALAAGCDLVLGASASDRHGELLAGVAAAQQDGRLPAARVRQSLRRIVRLKQGWMAPP